MVFILHCLGVYIPCIFALRFVCEKENAHSFHIGSSVFSLHLRFHRFIVIWIGNTYFLCLSMWQYRVRCFCFIFLFVFNAFVDFVYFSCRCHLNKTKFSGFLACLSQDTFSSLSHSFSISLFIHSSSLDMNYSNFNHKCVSYIRLFHYCVAFFCIIAAVARISCHLSTHIFFFFSSLLSLWIFNAMNV